MENCKRCYQPLNDRKAGNTIQFHSGCLAVLIVLLFLLSGCVETGNPVMDQTSKVVNDFLENIGFIQKAPFVPPLPEPILDVNVSTELFDAVGLTSDNCSVEWTNICYNFPTGLGTGTFHWCSNNDCARPYTCEDLCPIGTSCQVYDAQNLCERG